MIGAMLLSSGNANPWDTGSLENLKAVQVFQIYGSLCDYSGDIFDYSIDAFKKRRVDLIASNNGGGSAIYEIIDLYKGKKTLALLQFRCDYEISSDYKTTFIVNSIELIGAAPNMPSTVTFYRKSNMLIVPSDNWRATGLESAKKLIDELVTLLAR